MKLRLFLSAAIVLIIGLLIVELGLNGREVKEQVVEKNPAPAPTSVSQPQEKPTPSAPTLPATSAQLPIDQRVALWSEQIGQIQENPQVIEESLDQFSSTLSAQDILELKKIISSSQTQDERFLSTELLVRNRSIEAKQVLKEIALSPESSSEKQNAITKSEENALRLRAVEGLLKSDDPHVAKNLLEEVQRKSNNSIIQDRSQRALLSLKGIAKSPEEQDQEALRELLRR